MEKSQTQNVQVIDHDDILALKNKEPKEEKPLSFVQEFHTTYPYLASFLSFIILYLAMSLSVTLFINLAALTWRVDNVGVVALIANLVGAFYVFRYAIQKHLLPYVKP